jgi:hypothetical protein
MPTTLTYGRKKPVDGDDSAVWFDAIEDNTERDDAHSHDGVDSPKLSGTAIDKEDVVVKSTGDWSGSAGSYSLTIPNGEIPSGFLNAAKASSELCELVILDSDSSDERLYLKYTWSGMGATQTVTLYSNTVLNIKVLFV